MGGMMDADEQYDLRREAMAHEPTKRIVMDMSSDECQLETTYEQVHSVELGQTAKGDTADQVGEGLRAQAPRGSR